MITIRLNGQIVEVESGITLAAALINAGVGRFRTSVSGEPRAALCGMGICFECRVRVKGIAQARSCQMLVTEGLEVETDGPHA